MSVVHKNFFLDRFFFLSFFSTIIAQNLYVNDIQFFFEIHNGFFLFVLRVRKPSNRGLEKMFSGIFVDLKMPGEVAQMRDIAKKN